MCHVTCCIQRVRSTNSINVIRIWQHSSRLNTNIWIQQAPYATRHIMFNTHIRYNLINNCFTPWKELYTKSKRISGKYNINEFDNFMLFGAWSSSYRNYWQSFKICCFIKFIMNWTIQSSTFVIYTRMNEHFFHSQLFSLQSVVKNVKDKYISNEFINGQR